jgi:hypothetical protein
MEAVDRLGAWWWLLPAEGQGKYVWLRFFRKGLQLMSTQSGLPSPWNTCPKADLRSVTKDAGLPRSPMQRLRHFGLPDLTPGSCPSTSKGMRAAMPSAGAKG